MMGKRWLIALLLLPPLFADGQGIRLTKWDAPNALYLVTDHLYDFNMYERSRWGLGGIFVSPNQNAAIQRRVFCQWSVSAYAAYATGDHDFKYGACVQMRLPGPSDVKLRLCLYKDMERAASRNLDEYTMLTPSCNNGIVASRFSGVRAGQLNLGFSPNPYLDITFGIRQTWEEYRFDRFGPLYPAAGKEPPAPPNSYTELHGTLKWHKCLTLDARGGVMFDGEAHPYFRSILQYKAEPWQNGLRLFGQMGIATRGTPYSRMFDLSGTAFSLYFFNNSMLTVRPNTFTANMYANLCVSYTAPNPLWELSWSQPKAFLQLNAIYGRLFGQDGQGRLEWDGLPLSAPYKGLLEPASGFDGLIRWGLIDLGFAVAYQICPLSAPYLNEEPTDNVTLAIVANFVLDKYKTD